MSDQREPIRWRDAQSGADPVLRQLLHSAAHGGPSATHKRALDEAILRHIATQADVESTPTPERWLRRKFTWLVVVGLAGSAWLGISWQPLRREPAAPAPERATPTVLETPRAAQPAAVGGNRPELRARDSEAAADQPAVTSRPRRELSAARATTVRAKTTRAQLAARQAVTSESQTTTVQASDHDSSAVPERTSVAPELELLARAQRALREDTAEALELARVHARTYPTGTFSEEREAITIEALIATGQLSLARQRARDFLSRHKSSAYAARVARLLRAD